MARRLPTIWPIQPHTRAKHAILRRYLDAWFPIITRRHARALYIDGFAGPGKYANGEEGSPIIAIKAALDHHPPITAELIYFFVEANAERKSHLDTELAQLVLPPNVQFETHLGVFDETIREILDDLVQANARLIPTFAFVDPFGFSQTPFDTVARLLGQPSSEVFVNFMYEEVNRFLKLPDQSDNLDALLGSREWRGIVSVKEPGTRRRLIRELYEERLRKAAKFVRSFEMRNSKGATDYFLYFATNNVLGFVKMKEAMWKLDPAGGFTFSDGTNPNQPVLFDASPDFVELRRQIEQRFRQRTVRVAAVDKFVCEETIFLPTHYKRILTAMESEQSPALNIVYAKPNRQRGTFPDDVIIRFC